MTQRGYLAVLMLIAVLALATGAHDARAQQAATATQIKIFAPWNSDGSLNTNLKVRSRDSFPPPFSCQTGSIATKRPDAWRCGTDDPCFAPPMALPGDQSVTLACATAPWAGNVQLLTLQTPLGGTNDCGPGAGCRPPLDLSGNPWAIELANGVRCTVFTGTISSIGGVGMTYGCANVDGSPAGSAGTATAGLDRGQPVWRAFYQSPGDYSLQQVGVLVAWY
jgi:hypothetical protein